MKKRKTAITLFLAMILLVSILVGVGHSLVEKHRARNEIVSQLRHFLAEFQKSGTADEGMHVYLADDNGEYLILKLPEYQIMSMREADGAAWYCTENGVWHVDASGKVSEAEAPPLDIMAHVQGILNEHAPEDLLRYSCKRAGGSELPYCVSYDEYYLVRTGQDDPQGYHTVLAVEDEKELPCLRWYVLHPDSSARLFVHSCDEEHLHSYLAGGDWWTEIQAGPWYPAA